MEYPYFKGLEADRYSFYRVPKALVKADLFQKMSGDAKLSYVTNSNEGEGLLFYGNTIIPFKDKFDTSLKLYSLMTTKPNEMGKYKEKKEA